MTTYNSILKKKKNTRNPLDRTRVANNNDLDQYDFVLQIRRPLKPENETVADPWHYCNIEQLKVRIRLFIFFPFNFVEKVN